MIAIIDYGVGNIQNVINAFERSGESLILTTDKNTLLNADGIVLPGVGAFKPAMDKLKALHLDEVIKTANERQIPILGICLGMQLLCEGSEEGLSEGAIDKGLGIFKGTLKKFDESRISPIPHMGWQDVYYDFQSEVNINTETLCYDDAYFVHSFYLDNYDKNQCIGWSYYQNQKVPSIMMWQNTIGIQFHPEKSSSFGHQWINFFIKLCYKEAVC